MPSISLQSFSSSSCFEVTLKSLRRMEQVTPFGFGDDHGVHPLHHGGVLPEAPEQDLPLMTRIVAPLSPYEGHTSTGRLTCL